MMTFKCINNMGCLVLRWLSLSRSFLWCCQTPGITVWACQRQVGAQKPRRDSNAACSSTAVLQLDTQPISKNCKSLGCKTWENRVHRWYLTEMNQTTRCYLKQLRVLCFKPSQGSEMSQLDAHNDYSHFSMVSKGVVCSMRMFCTWDCKYHHGQ